MVKVQSRFGRNPGSQNAGRTGHAWPKLAEGEPTYA
jgi:hypothetical protein